MKGKSVPRLGVTYKAQSINVFHAFYGRHVYPAEFRAYCICESQYRQNTKAAPDDPTGFRPRAERSHYFEVGSYHALSQ